MASWLQNFRADFNRADGALPAAEGWSSRGSMSASNDTNRLKITSPSGGNAYKTDILARPVGEASQDQRIIGRTVPNIPEVAVYLRLQAGSTTGYLALISGGNLLIFSIKNGGNEVQLLSTAIPSFDASHVYDLDVSAVGVSPTTISYVVTDVTAAAVRLNSSLTNNLAELQTTGVLGVLTAFGNTCYFDSVVTYQQDAGVLVAVTDANWRTGRSPANWYEDSAGWLYSSNTGAYFKCGFQGTALRLLIEQTKRINDGWDTYPYYEFRIDGGSWTRTQLSATATILALASGLSNANHTVEFNFNATRVEYDRWTGAAPEPPAAGLKILGLVLDSGKVTVAPTVLTRKLAAFGDSITEGYNALSVSEPGGQNARLDWAARLAEALTAEYGLVGYGATSYSAGGDGNVPKFATHYNLHYTGITRDAPSDLTDLFINQGHNGSASSSDVAAMLTELRDWAPAGCRIYQVLPFSQNNASGINAGFAAYQLATPDALAFLIDLGAISYTKTDTAHPDTAGHQTLADALAALPEISLADTTPPTLSSPTIPSNGATLTATLSESGCLPASGTGGFTLGGTSASVASWAISGTTLTLTLTGTPYQSETVTWSWNRATTTDDIHDAAGNFLADFSDQAVTNNSTQVAPSSGPAVLGNAGLNLGSGLGL